MTDDADQELIRKILAGDDRAFELLVERHQDAVARFIWKVVPVQEDREEICQDVFVKVFFKLAQFNGEAKFTTWLYQVAYRSAISFNRKKRPVHVDSNVGELLPQEDADPDASGLRILLAGQIEKLGLEERTIITLHYMQDLSMDEIAEVIGRPAGTVKSILHRARKKLQKHIEQSAPDLIEAIL